MKFLFVIGFLAFVMFLLWGIISKFQRKKSRWKLLGSFLGLVVVLIAAPSPEDTNSSEENETQTNAVVEHTTSSEPLDSKANNNETLPIKKETVPSNQPSNETFIGILSLEEFKNNYENAVTKHNLDKFSIRDLEAKDESAGGGTFNYMLNNKIALTGTYNEKSNIEIVSLLLEGDGTEETGKDMIVSMGLFIMGTNPNFDVADTEVILREMGLDGNDPNKIINGSSTVKDGIRYSLRQVANTKVIMLSARNANDA